MSNNTLENEKGFHNIIDQDVERSKFKLIFQDTAFQYNNTINKNLT